MKDMIIRKDNVSGPYPQRNDSLEDKFIIKLTAHTYYWYPNVRLYNINLDAFNKPWF